MAKVPFSLRIDSTLRDALSRHAQAHGVSVTDLTTEALRRALHARCPTCGRTADQSVTPGGFTTQFEEFLETQRTTNPNGLFLVLSIEGGVRLVYWGSLYDATPPANGMLMMRARFDPYAVASVPVGIPRGCIVDWRNDPEGRMYQQLYDLGWENGNAQARALAEQR